jgi:heme exporter protein D
MHWNNATDFFAMGGYALYVWGSFGACALGLLIEPLAVRRQRRAVLERLREQNGDVAHAPHRIGTR